MASSILVSACLMPKKAFSGHGDCLPSSALQHSLPCGDERGGAGHHEERVIRQFLCLFAFAALFYTVHPIYHETMPEALDCSFLLEVLEKGVWFHIIVFSTGICYNLLCH